MHAANIDSFIQHINSINPHIKFTSEQEEDGKLAFLDTCVHVNEDGSTKTTVYRKPTHTDQYLNFTSNHHLQHKRSVLRTLLHRAELLVSEEEDKAKEVQHIQSALLANGYKRWMFKVPSRPSPTSQANNTSETTRPISKITKTRKPNTSAEPVAAFKSTAVLPYVKGLSEQLRRCLQQQGVRAVFKSETTLRSQLVRPKDAVDSNKQDGVVYRIPCKCGKVYIGETGRPMQDRIKENDPDILLARTQTSAVDNTLLLYSTTMNNHNIFYDIVLLFLVFTAIFSCFLASRRAQRDV
ncbi:hypothetical protein ACROYT_G032340 [Oculina patagonica]